MKKTIMAFAAAATFMLTVNAIAQTVSENDLRLSLAFVVPAEKINAAVTATTTASVNMKALKDFQKTFKSVANAAWYLAADGGFIASFTKDDVENSVAYNSKGNWVYSIKRYFEDQLPKDVRAEIKSTYYDYNITHVEEVLMNETPIYIVHLEDAKTMKTLRMSDGEMQIVQDLVKG